MIFNLTKSNKLVVPVLIIREKEREGGRERGRERERVRVRVRVTQLYPPARAVEL